MAGNGIGAAGRINSDFRPEYACRNLHGSDLWNRNTLIVAPEEPGFNAADTLRSNHDTSRKYEIALSPAAGRKGFCRRAGGRFQRCTHFSLPFPAAEIQIGEPEQLMSARTNADFPD